MTRIETLITQSTISEIICGICGINSGTELRNDERIATQQAML